MGYRGRLIHPMNCSIQQIDMAATRGAGGYDDTLDEPSIIPEPDVGGIPPIGSPRGAVATLYATTIIVPAQVNPINLEAQRQAGAGNDPARELELTFHFRDLENLAMIDASGAATFRNNDRLVGITSPNGNTNEIWREDQYLYAIRVQPDSYGMPGADRNLLIITFQERRQGVENIA